MKQRGDDAIPQPELVAPHAGAWIETRSLRIAVLRSAGRPPRGGVD